MSRLLARSHWSRKHQEHYGEQLAAIDSHVDHHDRLRRDGLAGRDGARRYKTVRTDRCRSSRIVEFFGDDSKRITFVKWAN